MIQCKDIPTLPILQLMASEPDHWWYWFNTGEWSITRAMPDNLPPKLVQAKMRNLIIKGYVDGCPCGCRGDYELTNKGRALLEASHATRNP